MREAVYHAPVRVDGANADAVQEEMASMFKRALEGTGDKVLFVADMEKTEYISSAGLRALTVILKRANAAGGSFVLRHVNDTLSALLDVTGLSGYLPVE